MDPESNYYLNFSELPYHKQNSKTQIKAVEFTNWTAEETRPKVAILKIIKQANVFFKEIGFLQKCNQLVDNSLKYFYSCKHQERYYIFMEYCQKGSLADEIHQKIENQLYYSENEVIYIFATLCQTLKQFHRNNIYHRDIKPDNIFITSESIYKFGDLGESKNNAGNLNTIRGTVGYMSPHLFKVYKEIKSENHQAEINPAKEDIWSLGKTFLEVAARTVFLDFTNLKIGKILEIAEKKLKDRGYSETFIKVLLCMLKDTRETLYSIEDFSEYFEAIQNGKNFFIREDVYMYTSVESISSSVASRKSIKKLEKNPEIINKFGLVNASGSIIGNDSKSKSKNVMDSVNSGLQIEPDVPKNSFEPIEAKVLMEIPKLLSSSELEKQESKGNSFLNNSFGKSPRPSVGFGLSPVQSYVNSINPGTLSIFNKDSLEEIEESKSVVSNSSSNEILWPYSQEKPEFRPKINEVSGILVGNPKQFLNPEPKSEFSNKEFHSNPQNLNAKPKEPPHSLPIQNLLIPNSNQIIKSSQSLKIPHLLDSTINKKCSKCGKFQIEITLKCSHTYHSDCLNKIISIQLQAASKFSDIHCTSCLRYIEFWKDPLQSLAITQENPEIFQNLFQDYKTFMSKKK